jgi:peptide/nickel transport system substrate-binding protein
MAAHKGKNDLMVLLSPLRYLNGVQINGIVVSFYDAMLQQIGRLSEPYLAGGLALRLFNNKGRTTLVAVLGILTLVMAACGNSSSNGSTPANKPYDFTYNYESPASNASNTIIYGEYQAVDTLSPIFAGSEVDIKNINEIFDGCLVQLPDLTKGNAGFMPDQCKEVPSTANGDESADGTSTTVKIDTSIKWSDGTPLSADDMLLSYGLTVDPNVLGSPAPFNFIKSLVEVDPGTVKITWTQPFSQYLFAIPGFLPAHVYPKLFNTKTHKYIPQTTASATALQGEDDFNQHIPVSNGPYTVKSISPDTVVYQKNPNFKSNFFKGAPSASTLIFKSTGDVNTSIADFKTGGLDQVDDFKFSDIANFTGIPQSQQVTSPLESYDFITFNQRPQALNAADANNNTKASVFTNKSFRKAIFEAIDVCTGIITILGDSNCKDPNVYATENTAPPAYDYDPSFTPAPFDLNQAKADLVTAGFKNCTYSSGARIKLQIVTTSGNPTRANYMALIDTALSKLGCNISLTTVPAAVFFAPLPDGTLSSGKWDLAIHGYINGSNPLLNAGAFDYNQLPGSAGNPAGVLGDEAGINDPQIESDIKDAYAQTDATKVASDMQDLQRTITSNFYNKPLYLDPNITLVAPTLHNYKLNPASAGNTWNIADWWSTAQHSS